MRTLLILLFSTVAALAQPVFPPAFWAPAKAAAGPSYLLQEDFEDATVGYDNNNANGWWAIGSPNAKYTTSPAPLAGTQSIFVNNDAGTIEARVYVTSSSDIWFYFLVNETRASIPIRLYNSSTNTLITIHPIGAQWCVDDLVGHSNCGGSFAINTTYSLWLHYVAGSGANGVVELYASTTTTKPSLTATLTNGAWTTNVRILGIGGGSFDNVHYIVDHVKASASSIGDNP